MKRRSFIRSTAFTVPVVLSGVPAFAAKQSIFGSLKRDNDRIVVIIQLDGGNDGLNTVIPLDQYANLQKARPDIVLSESDTLGIENDLGLHTMMSGMQNLYQDGKLTIVQNVGYPNQNRSHFLSKDIWLTGSAADDVKLEGWLGRNFEIDDPQFPIGYPNMDQPDPFAITIGREATKTCQGTGFNYSIALEDPTDSTFAPLGLENDQVNGVYKERLDYLRNIYNQTNEYGKVMTSAFDRGNDNSALYSDIATNPLAQKLNIVGQLIEGGLQTGVYVVNLGGFDTHGDQSEAGDPTSGRHPILLDHLSKAISAFQNHVESIGQNERVLGLTVSEFGRRILANGSYGTDHGSASPMFFFGSCVQGGVIGDNPEISDDPALQEGVAMQHDFRSVYATVFKDWLGIEENRVENVLLGDFEYLPIIYGCEPSVNLDETEDPLVFNLYPNPARDNINFSVLGIGKPVRIRIFDTLGHLSYDEPKRNYSLGLHRKRIDISNFSSGAYILHCQSEGKVFTKRFVKV